MAEQRTERFSDAEELRRAVDGYFSSISRTVDAVEHRETGEKDAAGRKMTKDLPILSDAGEQIRYREYVVPPTLWGLCEYLGISLETWQAYCDGSRYPAYQAAAARAAGHFREWNERELLTRKDVRGVIYHMENSQTATQSGVTRPAGADMSLAEKRALLETLRDEMPDGETE